MDINFLVNIDTSFKRTELPAQAGGSGKVQRLGIAEKEAWISACPGCAQEQQQGIRDEAGEAQPVMSGAGMGGSLGS